MRKNQFQELKPEIPQPPSNIPDNWPIEASLGNQNKAMMARNEF